VLFILGTRPEAIKLCPVIQCLRGAPDFAVSVCATAQHREMLDQVLALFGVEPEHDLGVMREGQTLYQASAAILAGLEQVMAAEKPDLVVVQGDTTTTLCGALAGFYARAPVGHVEAGLRTRNRYRPFPEEMNRVLVTQLSTLHFAATEWAANNLRAEGVREEQIALTGNPGIDAVLSVARRLEAGELTVERSWTSGAGRKLIAVTAHRRESFGAGFVGICEALRRLAKRADVEIVYPVHPNPNVRGPVLERLGGAPGIRLIPPLDYLAFVDLMRSAYLLLTDSGGVQEEGPSLGKPVLVMREETERPEAVEAGTARLVGTDPEQIVREVELLVEDEREWARRAQIRNPYGDGLASGRILAAMRRYFAGG
jgi:UDP-N-acetylglucosamine 2-epimerase (non-hydrolysing)